MVLAGQGLGHQYLVQLADSSLAGQTERISDEAVASFLLAAMEELDASAR